HVIKEYGLKELEKSGELRATLDKHARYYLQLAQRIEGELRGPVQDEWLKIIEDEHENMLAALRTLEENGAVEGALHLLAVLGALWFKRARFISEGRTYMKRVLSASSRQALSQGKSPEFIMREGTEGIKGTVQQWRGITELRAKVLHWAAGLAWRQDDMGTAHLFNEES